MDQVGGVSADYCRAQRLLGSLKGCIYWTATYWCRVGVLQFVSGEGRDDALRFRSELIRVRTGLDFERDRLAWFIHCVCSEVGDRSDVYGLGFLRRHFGSLSRRDLGKIGSSEHDKEATVCIKTGDAFRIGAKVLLLAAILVRLLP